MSHILSGNIQKNIQLLFPPQDQRTNNKVITESSVGFYSTLSTTEYRNAIYFGKINKTFQKNGIGVVFYDNGDVLIADFFQDKIKGHFFYFDSQVKGMCFYGAMEHNTQKIDGTCYVYARNGQMTQGMYQQGKLLNNWFSKSTNNQIMKHQFISTQIINNKDQKQNNKLKVGRRKQKSTKSSFITPTDFLILHLTRQPNEKSDILLTNQPFEIVQTQFQLFQIAKNQTYYGILQNNKPKGFGIIFLNDWPVCYGSFINGQLHGLARVQQKKNLILDGIFDGSSLKMGWVLNFQQNLTCFGVLQKDQQETSRRIFQLREQFSEIKIQKIVKFRRHFHIKSLTYINSHLLQYGKKIKAQYNSQQLLFMFRDDRYENNQLQKQDGQMQQNFIPSYISQIERVNGNTSKSKLIVNNQNIEQQNYQSNNNVQRDLIQLIKQYHENASNFEKASKLISSQIKKQEKMPQSTRSRSKSKTIDKNIENKLKQQKSQSKEEKNKLKSKQKKSNNKTKQAKIEDINKIPDQIANVRQLNRKEEKQALTERKVKKLDLQQIYNKYLKKLQKYNTRSS